MKNISIIGATGFGGLGLIDLILKHPGLKIKQLVARKDSGNPVSSVFPHLKGFCDIEVEDSADISFDGIDLAFFSTPDRAGMTLIKDFYSRNIPVIDFSGDFRFNSVEDYKVYAENKGMESNHHTPELLSESVYGLPEKFSTKLKTAKIVGNPGCFSICMILGLLPAAENNYLDSDTIICDGKTGVSGAGKNSGEPNLYPQRYENINTYREGKHQHLVEVENLINFSSKRKRKIFFVPQIVPMNRGIMTTMYSDAPEGCTTEKLLNLYSDYYSKSPFVVISDKSPNTAYVRGSNRCLIRPFVDNRTGKICITSVIDNLMKGQSGNAIQTANLMLGFEEKAGLDFPGFYP